ncbi:hypothetical protein BO78DRAFT_91698 [Aspergillus sclerotiicarbonarius CBS 121057]|uniref:Uncharacterized protein n=1 Tax=Aspergillus sclerotiicarbonarius (strain CBS 121057 / IBT 28362) TaxID=1448318 RepID=A0A319ETQ1_ASPSB|nr:hypothetical protein BO78DRAFT_91698 [Aspergillus sclerotiicarbonarius CBS 121057]
MSADSSMGMEPLSPESIEEVTSSSAAVMPQFYDLPIDQLSRLFYRSHIAYLRHILQSTVSNNTALERLREDMERQRHREGDLKAANDKLAQRLEQESANHAMTRQILATEMNMKEQMRVAFINAQQQQLASYHQDLHIRSMRHEETVKELERTQRKFHLVDDLVDAMLLQEDSQLDLDDRSRQITDVILDLEDKMEMRYRDAIDASQSRIASLEGMMRTCTCRDSSYEPME